MLYPLLSTSFPAFQGRYGCCRFLRDGYRTPKEVSVLGPATCQNLTAKQQLPWAVFAARLAAVQRLW